MYSRNENGSKKIINNKILGNESNESEQSNYNYREIESMSL